EQRVFNLSEDAQQLAIRELNDRAHPTLCRWLRPGAWLLLAGRDPAIDGGLCRCRAVIGDQSASLCCLEQSITHLLLVEGAAADELAKIKRSLVERAVARAGQGSDDGLALALERRLGVGANLLRLGEHDQPGRGRGEYPRTVRVPSVRPAGAVTARRQDN